MPGQKLKIPEMVYVKFQERTRDGDEYILGYMTPYDKDDKDFKERKSSVDNWSRPYRGWGRKEVRRSLLSRQAFVGYNEEMEGFKLLHTVSRYRTSNKVWRLADPRGFELEISSWNLSEILQYATIEQGAIQEPCIWARDANGENWLVVVGSEPHLEAKEYTEVRSNRISLRDINRGDTVSLHDGREVEYLGGFYFPFWTGTYTSANRTLDVRRRYVFRVVEGKTQNTFGDSTLDLKSSVKVGKLLKENPLTDEEAEAEANGELEHIRRIECLCFQASKFEVEDISFQAREIDDLGTHLSPEDKDRQVQCFFMESEKGVIAFDPQQYGGRELSCNGHVLDWTKLQRERVRTFASTTRTEGSSWGFRSRTVSRVVTHQYSVEDLLKLEEDGQTFYAIELVVGDSAYPLYSLT